MTGPRSTIWEATALGGGDVSGRDGLRQVVAARLEGPGAWPWESPEVGLESDLIQMCGVLVSQ